ncbi:extracellular calcium-sensing receptor-like [Spea bombifrons]|uniref:extracellular calcium-sensing receptor-like n=1 Tax=Spea bombifrons TaxID=233779 RepID=UPI00234A943E|nr:extracellular calcium-sensing receptor-like [Spea bombifrons]
MCTAPRRRRERGTEWSLMKEFSATTQRPSVSSALCHHPPQHSHRTSARLQDTSIPGTSMTGDLVIGGIFPVQRSSSTATTKFTSNPVFQKCDNSFDFRSYRWIRAMVYAIQEINRNEYLLPNITVGYAIYDSCDNIAMTIGEIFTMLTGLGKSTPNYHCQMKSPLIAVIGESASAISIAMARILGTYHYPQVSYFSSINTLSNKQDFPSFFRTIPSDTFQTTAFAAIVERFGWKWVGTLAEDNDYGYLGVQLFSEQVQKFGTCIAFSETIPLIYSKQRYSAIAETIQQSSAKVIIIFSGDTNLLPLFWEIAEQNITGRTWLASEGWSTSAFLLNKDQTSFFKGTLGLAIPEGNIAGLHQFLLQLNPMQDPEDNSLKMFWGHAFGCSWDDHVKKQSNSTACTGNEHLSTVSNAYTQVSQLRITCNVYNAVFAIANALKGLLTCGNNKGSIKNEACASVRDVEPWQVVQSLKRVRFTDQDGKQLYFDQNGDPVCKYDVVNWQIGTDGYLGYKKVGGYDASATIARKLVIDESATIWNGDMSQPPLSECSSSCKPGFRKSVIRGQPVCCFICVPCPEGEISNGTDFTECLKCPQDYWSNKNKDSCVPKSVDYLSFEEPLGTTFSVFAALGICQTVVVTMVFIKYRHTPIVRAHNLEMSFLLLISLILCFLGSFTFIGEPSPALCVLRQTVVGISFVLCISCILVKTLVVLLAFTMSKPNQNVLKFFRPCHQRVLVVLTTLVQFGICVGFLSSTPPSIKKNTRVETTKIILECNPESDLAFLFAIGYIGLLALVCFTLAFLARNLPDNFNEAKFITFSLLVFVMVWISFIPGYMSTSGKYITAVEIFAILSSAAGLLICIFFPKCYIILLKPTKNTKKNLTGRSHQAK